MSGMFVKKRILNFCEKKTGKVKKFPINQKLENLLRGYIVGKSDSRPLFESQKQNRLDRSQVYRLLNEACAASGVDANVGTHTMREKLLGIIIINNLKMWQCCK